MSELAAFEDGEEDGNVVPLNVEAAAALEWRKIARAERVAKLTTAEYLGEKLPIVLQFLVEVVEGRHTQGVWYEGARVGEETVAVRDRIRAAQEINRLVGLTRDSTRVQVAVGALPSRAATEEDDGDGPIATIVAALRMSAHDGGDNARLAQFLERIAADEARQHAAAELRAGALEVASWEGSIEEPPIEDAEIVGELPPEPPSIVMDEPRSGARERPAAPPPSPPQEERRAPVEGAPWQPPDF